MKLKFSIYMFCTRCEPEIVLTLLNMYEDHQRICCLYPKFENQFFVNLHVLYKLQTWNCCASFSNQNKIQKFSKSQTSKFGIDLPCILLIIKKLHLRLYMEWEPIVLSMLQHCAETCHFLMDLEEKLPLCFFFLFGSLEETPIL